MTSHRDSGHTTLAVGHAAIYDTADDWPFDDIHDPAIIMTADTAQSAGKGLSGIQSAALEHGNALVLRHPGLPTPITPNGAVGCEETWRDAPAAFFDGADLAQERIVSHAKVANHEEDPGPI